MFIFSSLYIKTIIIKKQQSSNLILKPKLLYCWYIESLLIIINIKCSQIKNPEISEYASWL